MTTDDMRGPGRPRVDRKEHKTNISIEDSLHEIIKNYDRGSINSNIRKMLADVEEAEAIRENMLDPEEYTKLWAEKQAARIESLYESNRCASIIDGGPEDASRGCQGMPRESSEYYLQALKYLGRPTAS